jgi:hypothetical protein
MQSIMHGKILKITIAMLLIVAALLLYALLHGSSGAAPINTTSIIVGNVYAPSSEIPNLTPVYPNANFSTLSCNYNSDCAIVHTKSCFNNLNSQQACINKSHVETYDSYYAKFLSNNATACPQYFILNNVSCACINNWCSLVSR